MVETRTAKSFARRSRSEPSLEIGCQFVRPWKLSAHIPLPKIRKSWLRETLKAGEKVGHTKRRICKKFTYSLLQSPSSHVSLSQFPEVKASPRHFPQSHAHSRPCAYQFSRAEDSTDIVHQIA